MGKVLSGNRNCDIFDAIFSEHENILSGLDLSVKKTTVKNSLSASVKYLSANNIDNMSSVVCIGFSGVSFNDDLSNAKVRSIALQLAEAIDRNSVSEVKRIRTEYGNTKEFLKARDFLNKKCKDVWNVYEGNYEKTEVPYDALKVLGISNQPSLESMLGDSLKFYEKDNGSTTVDIIRTILSNPKMNYTFDDIYRFLKSAYQKDKCRYNFKTVSYLTMQLEADEKSLNDLGIEKSVVDNVLKTFPFKQRVLYMFKRRFKAKAN